MPNDILSKDLVTYDPLSETTRKERTSLLGISMLGVALVRIPLVPEKLSLLGIEFSKVNQSEFVKMYALVVIYYMCAFLLYALSDYVAWRRQEAITIHEYYAQKAEWEAEKTEEQLKRIADARVDAKINFRGVRNYWFAFRVARARALFEFLMPLGFAGYTLSLLYSYAK
ncbi:hypothetical protein [Massilia varians]|uniref:hypothetical protein n=1 Tax=Massilia varians TaxID=457921 RepID=UPI0025527B20|nr:hypothetical protein [Massilia varians]MDK6077953.1 hypothetical protein [Massilia varians]